MTGLQLRGAGEPERLLRPQEVAELTGLSYHAVLRAVHRGELRAFRLCGRIRIHPIDVQDWMEAHRIERRGTNSAPTPLFGSEPEPERGSHAALRALEPDAKDA